jgi:hypothetical protein
MQKAPKQPTRDQFNLKFDIEAKQLSEKFNISLDDAKVALRRNMREIANPSQAQRQPQEETRRAPEKEERGFYGNVYDYMKHGLTKERTPRPSDEKFNLQLNQEAEQLAAQYDIPLEEAKEILRKQMRELEEAKRREAKQPFEKEEKGFFSKLYDYGAETVAHPLDRAGQLVTEFASSIPAMADVGHYLYQNIGGEQPTTGTLGDEFYVPAKGDKPTKKEPYKPLGWSEFTRKMVGDTLKRELDLNKAESPFAENVNAVLSVVPQMATFSGVGKALQKGGKLIGDVAKSSEVLGKAGKKGVEAIGKVPSAVGKFFEAGSNIKSPVDLGSNIGAVAAPYALPEEDRGLGMSAGASMLGALTGGKLAGSAVRNLPKNRAWKETNKDKLLSDAAQINKLYEDAGVTSQLFNVSDSDSIRLATKSSEKSIFGSNVKEALENQKQQVSGKITPLHESDFHKSEFGTKLKPKFEEHLEKIDQEFGNRFDKIKEDVATKTNSTVPLKNVDEYLGNLLKNVSHDPAHIRLWLSTPVGQAFQDFYSEGLKVKIRDLYNQGKRQPGFDKTELGKNIRLLEKMVAEDVPSKAFTINGVQADINPTLEKILQSKLLKERLLQPTNQNIYAIDYRFADDLLRNIGGKRGVFKKYFKKKDIGELEGLYGALRQDVRESIGAQLAAKEPRAALHMERTWKDYSKFAKESQKDLNALESVIDNPIEFVDMLSRDKKTSGNKASEVLDSLNAGEKEYFRNNFNRMIGSAGEKSNQPFDPLIWNRRYKDLDKSVKQKIYQKETPYYDRLSNVIEDINKVHSLANTSGSGTHVISKAEQASIIAAAGKAIKSAATGAALEGLKYVTLGVVPKLIDIGLTNQGIKNLYIKIQNAKTMKEALNALNGITKATTKTSVRTTLQNLYRSFNLLDKEQKNK